MRTLLSNRSNNKGMALISVLMVFIVLFILGVALLQVALADTGQATWQSNRVQAHYLARSGVHHGIQLLEDRLDDPTPFTGTIAELSAYLNGLASGSPYTIPDVGTYTLRFEEGLYAGEIKIISTGTVNGNTTVNQTVTYTKALGDSFQFANPAGEWMTGINLEKAIKPSNSGESYLGEAVLLETKNSKNSLQSPKGSSNPSTFQASIIVFREYQGISLRQITNSINLTFDAEIIIFTGDILLNKNSTPLYLSATPDGVLLNHTTTDNSIMVRNFLSYEQSTGFEDEARYLAFIDETTTNSYRTANESDPGFVSGAAYGIIGFRNIYKDNGSTTILVSVPGATYDASSPFSYYYFQNGTNLQALTVGDLVQIDKNDPIVDVLNSLLGVSMGSAPPMWNDK